MDFTVDYRPKRFLDVVGQKEVVKSLKALRDLQVLLFYGPPGTGKTTLARIYAAQANCENGDVDECNGSCKNCKSIFNNEMTDVLEENVGDSRGIDDMRRISEWIKFKPMVLPKRVLILDEVQMLTKTAQNMLLKVLEEPPTHALIILCTTDVSSLIEPLRQRCFQFQLKKVGKEDLLQLAKKVISTEIQKGVIKKDNIDGLVPNVVRIITEADGTPRKMIRRLQNWIVSGTIVDDIEEDELHFYKFFDDLIMNRNVLNLKNSIYKLAGEEDIDKITRLFLSYVQKKMLQSNTNFELASWSEVLREYMSLNYSFVGDKYLVFFKLINAGLKAIELQAIINRSNNESSFES